MAYIAPDSDIEFCRGFPLDRAHDYAIYFASASAQYSAIHAYASKIYDKNSYQRVNQRTIRVGELADNLQGVNYMVFRNTAFGTKWFYAFVDEVNYINNSVCEVVYTIDPLQTYLFDFNWNACLVEREHTLTDVVGQHTETENFAQVTQKYTRILQKRFDSWTYIVASTKNLAVDPSGYTKASQWPNSTPAVYDGVLQGCGLYLYSSISDFANTVKYLDDLGIGNAIVAIFALPSEMVSSPFANSTVSSSSFTQSLSGALDGYTPKNKKLYTSPYCNIVLSGNGVNVKNFDVQGFTITGGSVSGGIVATCSINANSGIIAYPQSYRGIGVVGLDPYGAKEYAVQLGNALQGSWSSDTYANWQAQTGTSRTLTAVMSVLAAGGAVVGAVASGGAGAPLAAGAIVGAVSTIASTGINQATENLRMQNLPNTLNGGVAAGDINLARGDFGFRVYFAYPVANQAEKIDAYFTRYGYACNKIKVPSTNNRPYWTYVKTNGCAFTSKVGSGIPAPDMEAINSYFDRGITWFKTAADVGRFDRDNSV